jgi:hypothetical protein
LTLAEGEEYYDTRKKVQELLLLTKETMKDFLEETQRNEQEVVQSRVVLWDRGYGPVDLSLRLRIGGR